MFISDVISEYQKLEGATIQVVSVEERLGLDGAVQTKDGMPKYRVEAVCRSRSGLSVAAFTATHEAGAMLSGADAMSSWRVLDVDGWLYPNKSGRVQVAMSVKVVEPSKA